MPSRMKLTKNLVFLHYFTKFMGILLFVLKYMYTSLLLKMINGFSWPAKIMASPFKGNCKTWTKLFWSITQKLFDLLKFKCIFEFLRQCASGYLYHFAKIKTKQKNFYYFWECAQNMLIFVCGAVPPYRGVIRALRKNLLCEAKWA